MNLFMECTECGAEEFIKIDGDNPIMCPQCRSIDTMEDVFDDEPDYDAITAEELQERALDCYFNLK